MCIKTLKKRIEIDVLTKTYPSIPLSGHSESLLQKVHIPFQENQFLKIVRSQRRPLRPQDVRPEAEEPLHGCRGGERRVVLVEQVQPSTSLQERKLVVGNVDVTVSCDPVPAGVGSLHLLLEATLCCCLYHITSHIPEGVIMSRLVFNNNFLHRVHPAHHLVDDAQKSSS